MHPTQAGGDGFEHSTAYATTADTRGTGYGTTHHGTANDVTNTSGFNTGRNTNDVTTTNTATHNFNNGDAALVEGYEHDPTVAGRAGIVEHDAMQTGVDYHHVGDRDDDGDVTNTHLGRRAPHEYQHHRQVDGTTGVGNGAGAAAEPHHVSLGAKIKGASSPCSLVS